jgi:prepilin-type N-terminal cleavage/methylation domain-containing protein
MKRHPEGFSLIELMIAMTVTLIVSGAIYGLLTSGSNAFRREPEVADRQQNIRLAMDLITRDVFGAATALPTFSQSFTIQDTSGLGSCTGGLNGCGVPGSLGAAAQSARGDSSSDTDVLEILAADETCPFQTVCSAVTPGSAGLFVTRQPIPGCMALPGFVVLTNNISFVVQPAQAVASPTADCGGGGANGNLQLTASLAAWPPSGAMPDPTTTPVYLYGGRVVRYRIAPSGDPQDNSPALWRSATGVYGTDGSVKTEPGDASFTLGGGSPWQLVARGIEDLQVEYLSGAGWSNAPPVVVDTNYDTLVRRVRVTLSARVTAANLQGELAAGGAGPNAVRGQLVTEVAPRAVITELQIATATTHFK